MDLTSTYKELSETLTKPRVSPQSDIPESAICTSLRVALEQGHSEAAGQKLPTEEGKDAFHEAGI